MNLFDEHKAFEQLRLGQYFCNRYIKHPWPELFYEEDEKKAREMIKEWLNRHHYTLFRLPPAVREI